MKVTRIITGIAALILTIAAGSCGKASVVNDEAKIAENTKVNTAQETDPYAEVKNIIYKQLAAAQDGDKDAFTKAMDKELLCEAINSFYGSEVTDEVWDDLFSESWGPVSDEMKYFEGEVTIEDFVIEEDLTEEFDNGSVISFGFVIKNDTHAAKFVGSAIEFDGKTTAYINLGSLDDNISDYRTANAKTLWNGSAQICYENEIPDGEYSFDILAPDDSVLEQKLNEMLGDVMTGWCYVKVTDGEAELARWYETEDGEFGEYGVTAADTEE